MAQSFVQIGKGLIRLGHVRGVLSLLYSTISIDFATSTKSGHEPEYFQVVFGMLFSACDAPPLFFSLILIQRETLELLKLPQLCREHGQLIPPHMQTL